MQCSFADAGSYPRLWLDSGWLGLTGLAKLLAVQAQGAAMVSHGKPRHTRHLVVNQVEVVLVE